MSILSLYEKNRIKKDPPACPSAWNPETLTTQAVWTLVNRCRTQETPMLSLRKGSRFGTQRSLPSLHAVFVCLQK